MTAQSKTVIKSYFQSGDRPTQAQFEDLIDSYADTSSAVTSMTGQVTATINNGVATTAIASAAVGTSNIEGRAVSLAKLGFGSVGQTLYYAASGVPTLLNPGTNGQVLTMGASIPAWSSASTQTGSIPNAGYRTNYYYPALGMEAALAGLVVTANRLYTVPYVVGQTATFTRIGMGVSTGAPGNARLGIYNFSNGVATSLVLDAGTVATDTTGLKEVTISQNLSSGFYALGIVFDATPTVYYPEPTYYGFSLVSHVLGSPNFGGRATGNYMAHTYGALPASFTPSTDMTDPPQTPYMHLRVV